MNDPVLQRALALHRSGRLDEAIGLYKSILASDPRNPNTAYLLGSAHLQMGDFTAALDQFDQLLRLYPDHADTHAARATALSSMGRHEEALLTYNRALAIKPDHLQSWNNRGNTLLYLNRDSEALSCYDRAVAIKPDYAEAWRNRGTALEQLSRFEEALESLDQAIQLNPHYADAWEDRASLLMRLLRFKDAIGSYDRALSLKPRNADLLYNRGNAHSIAKNYEDAIRDSRAVLSINPDYPYARGVLLHSMLQSCQWELFEEEKAKALSALHAGKRTVSPFNLKAITDDADDQLHAAKIWVKHECPQLMSPTQRPERYGHGRARIAYISGDFNNTAVGNLMASVFEHHDKDRFDFHAISFGPQDKTQTRIRLETAFSAFADMRGRTDHEVASHLRARETDIAIDLMGFTGECRSTIFARRPAPIQVNYLGFPGTMAAPYMDYLISDKFVIPQNHQPFYAEKIAYLPHCLIPGGRYRTIPQNHPRRDQAGLPERGFVFASFNNSYKFNAGLFDIWMRLLSQIDDSVLWLPAGDEQANANLRKEANFRGVDPNRVIFAARIPNDDDHIARLSLADLFLDTFPYNAHSTSLDALWAGVPVVTLAGKSFASRVAGSALNTAGLPELITGSLEDYRDLALLLVRDQNKLSAVREKLNQNRLTCPLFDVSRFTGNLEMVYSTMWERHERGEPPATFAVASDV